MKKQSNLYFIIPIILIWLTSCEKPDQGPVMLEIKGSYLVKNQIQQEDLPVNDPQVINQLLTYGSITDIDENVYKTIQIGNQTWMAENLRTTRFNNGTVIPKVRWYDNNIGAYKNTYGALYDHYCVNTGDLCPTGWHVPTDEEWKELEMALGMTPVIWILMFTGWDFAELTRVLS